MSAFYVVLSSLFLGFRLGLSRTRSPAVNSYAKVQGASCAECCFIDCLLD